MSPFTFRYRLNLSPRSRLDIDTVSWEATPEGAAPRLVISSPDGETPIKESARLVFKSDGWPSEDEAVSAGQLYFPALALTLARLRVGADYGDRTPKSGFTPAGLSLLEQQHDHRFLNDELGLMVFESEPAPWFAGLGGTAVVAAAQDRFEERFRTALASPLQFDDRDRLALTLFNSSFFQDTAESRFLLLMMAVEAMLDPPPRSDAARDHVEALLTATRDSEQLSIREKDSLAGSLNWLKNESISHTGRALAAERLGERRYSNSSAPEFFTDCYGLRSSLVHGGTFFPTRQEVDGTAAQLEVFVADLLTGQYLGFE